MGLKQEFKKGDKVVCTSAFGDKFLKEGHTYIVFKAFSEYHGTAIYVEGIDFGYYEHRFKLAEEKETAIGCNCDLIALMRYGCKCGQMEREKC
jgi:hypothetical protein